MPLALDIKNLTKTYSNGFEALKGIDLEVKEGEFFALLGPNGAGKSTTIGIVTSLIHKSAGKVSIFGHDIDIDFSAGKACLGVVPQEFNFNIFERPLDILVNQAGYYGLDRKTAKAQAEKYLKRLELWDKCKQPSRNLSGGMKRRLLIARALLHEPKLLILDEPTAGVDIEIRRSMWDFLKQINSEGTTIILTTHYLEEAENLCQRVAIIDQGKIVENMPINQLAKKLHRETFVLNLESPLQVAPALNGYACRLVDEHTLEVDIMRDHPINQLFEELKTIGLNILSMRNKTNRLEELFLDLVRKD